MCGAEVELRAVVGSGQHPGHDRRTRGRPGDQVARRVARNRDLLDRVDLEPHQRGQDEVGERAAAHAVARTEREVHAVTPAQHVHQQLAGRGREAGRQADPDAVGPQRVERHLTAGQGLDLTPGHRAVERGLEALVRLLRPGFVAAEDGAEHTDLGLPHRAAHVVDVGPQLVAVGVEPHLSQRLDERSPDHAAVAHRRAGHVQHRESDHQPIPSNVSAAIAGDSVMPRPPGPVTITSPGSGVTRRHTDAPVACE